jgi:hypothetical protein
MPGGRPAKKLLEHVLADSFRPREHGRILAGEDLPLKAPHPDASPGMVRIWGRLRAVQDEYRGTDSVEHRHDLALEFSRLGSEYLQAEQRARRDPTKELDGLAEILTVNRRARRLAAQAEARRSAA